MPLAMASLGDTKVIRDLRGTEEVKGHLLNMGFIQGEEIRIVGDNPSGIIVAVKGVKIALNRGLAQKIIVM